MPDATVATATDDRRARLGAPGWRAWSAGFAAWLAVAAVSPSVFAQSPQPGGTVVIAVGADPTVLNPNVSVGGPELFTGCILYDALIRVDKDFNIVPSLAKSWEISKDGLTYSFKLQPAKWSDGRPVTSEDVKFTLLEVSKKFGTRFKSAGEAIDSVETPDPESVIVRLSQPFGPFLFSLSCEQNAAIMPAHVYRGADVLKHPATVSQPVSNGPFRAGEWVRGSHIVFNKNPDYWTKGEPYLDRIIVKIMPEASTRVLALQAGEIDFIEQYYFPLNAYQIFSRDPRFVAQEVNYPALNQIMLNTKQPPLDNPKVRQALLMALDRNYMLKNVFFGTGQVGRSAFDTRIKWSYNPAVDYDKLYPFDPAAAQKLLDEAGVTRGADGTRFTIRVTFESGRAEYIAWAQAIQRYWDAVGVKTVLDGAERNVTLKRVYADYDFGAHLQNYSTGGDPAIGIARAYVSDSIKQGQMFNNVSQYSNPEVDKLFEEGRKAADPAERAKHYFQVQEILAKDLPVLTIHQAAQIAAADARVKDFALAGGYLWWNRVWRSK